MDCEQSFLLIGPLLFWLRNMCACERIWWFHWTHSFNLSLLYLHSVHSKITMNTKEKSYYWTDSNMEKNDLFKSGVDSKAPNTYTHVTGCSSIHWLDWQYVRLIEKKNPLRILGRIFFSIFSLVCGKMMTMSRHDFHIPHRTKKKWGLYLQQHEHVMMTHWKKKS